MKLSKIYSIYKHKKKLNDNKKRKIIDLIKEENYDSIIASASFKVISEYLDIAVKSQKLYLFTLENKKELAKAELEDKICDISNKIEYYNLFINNDI